MSLSGVVRAVDVLAASDQRQINHALVWVMHWWCTALQCQANSGLEASLGSDDHGLTMFRIFIYTRTICIGMTRLSVLC